MGLSLSGIPYEIWVMPGIIFIIPSLCLFPLLYRDFFDLRIHLKVLVNVSLAPYSKLAIIGGYLFVAGIEATILGIISLFVISGFIAFPLSILQTVVMFLCLISYLFLLGNFFISMSLLIDTITTLFLMTALSFVYILFGNGFIIEFGFFPLGVESFLKWQPLSIPFQIFQQYKYTGIFDWALFSGSVLIGTLWTFANSSLLKRTFQH